MLKEKIEQDLKVALKSQDKVKVSTLRLLLSEIKNKEIDNKGLLADEQVMKLLQSSIKRRQEAITQFQAGKRDDLVTKEQQELAVVQSYLPKQMTDDELNRLIESTIQTLGASGPADFGKVMKAVMTDAAGRADGSRIAALVKTKLTG